jgi:hypothetical protein
MDKIEKLEKELAAMKQKYEPESIHCPKCLCWYTGMVKGEACKYCGSIIERQPEFKELVDQQPEEFMCLRRDEVPFQITPGPDHWNKFKSNGDRVCSYCGSLHPDDMFRLVKACADSDPNASYGSVVEVDPSDKSYKVYIHQPGVRNASEGGIKFYTHHLPRNTDGSLNVPDERNHEYSMALKKSNARFGNRIKSMRRI